MGIDASVAGTIEKPALTGAASIDLSAVRFRDVSMPGDSTSTIDSIVKKESQGPLPSLDRVVAKMRAGTWLAELIEQSGTSTTPSAVVVMMIATGTASIFAASTFIRLPFAPAFAGLVGGSMPLMYET